jgi:WG containing repeat
MRVLDLAEITEAAVLDLAFEADGELLAAVNAACIKLLEFVHDRDLRTRGRKTGKWGFVDASGRFVIAPRFDAVSGFSKGLAWAALPDPPRMVSDRQSRQRQSADVMQLRPAPRDRRAPPARTRQRLLRGRASHRPRRAGIPRDGALRRRPGMRAR